MVTNIRVPYNAGYFVTSWGTIGFKRRTLFNGVC